MIRYRKVGGLHFLWLGPFTFSWCKRKRKQRSDFLSDVHSMIERGFNDAT